VTPNTLRLGFIGLGQAAQHIIAELRRAEDFPWRIAAAADPRAHARDAFAQEFGGEVYADAADLCRGSDVDAVYIATPPWLHRAHVEIAAACGKHIICEKPMALTIEDCDAMVAAAKRHGIMLMAGHTHSFDAPVRKIEALVAAGTVGRLHAINSWNCNEFQHRSRLTAELEATRGPILNQGPHQIDIVRQIGGGLVRSVRAQTIMDGISRVEGGYVAWLEFESGVPATLVYDGRSLFDTAELFGWVGEGGQARDPGLVKKRRNAYREIAGLPAAAREARLESEKEQGRYGAGIGTGPDSRAKEDGLKQPFFGLLLVHCEEATIRQSPDGLYLYSQKGREELVMAREARGRMAELAELHASITSGRPPFHDGAWGTATLEVCFAIMESAAQRTEIRMTRQVASR
jgi:phthalate 4,5-cis-dihydrodiol dehydrogenase